MVENFVEKTLNTLLEVVEVEFKIPLGFAEIKFPVTAHAKKWWENKKSRSEVEEAIRRAEEGFIAAHPNEKLAQILHGFPLYAEEDYRRVVVELLKHLEEEKIEWLAEIKLEHEWDKLISREEIHNALELYLPFLRHELNGIEAFREIITARAIERIEKDVRQIKSSQTDFQQQFQHFEDLTLRQSEFLLQQITGVSNQIMIQNLELSPPDDVTLRPSTFLQREELIGKLQKDLGSTTSLFLVDGSGKGKTQLAISLYELWKGTDKYWITLRNKNELQDKHLRAQVIRWLYQITGELSYWQRYLLGDITFREIVIALGESLRDSGMLVVDDLPNPVYAESLYNDLEIIIKVFSGYGSKIVTTSQWGMPPHLISRFPSLVITRSCPNFSSEEILELLDVIRFPSALKTEKIAAIIFATTKGHASLVAATVSWLEKQGSEFKIETLDDLLSGEPVKDTLEYSRKVLINTLDDQPKELLYRLSLVGEKFDKGLLIEIANISPVITYPSEQLDKLTGPWVDRLDREYFDVSPLLSKVGEGNVPVKLVKNIHALCADRYLQTHIINISDLHIILSHLWQAHDYPNFGNVLVLALMSVKTYEQAKYIDWACSLLVDISWPDELNIHWRIIIRSAQLRTLALAKRNYKRMVDDLESLWQETDIEYDAPALLFSYMTISFFADDLPLSRAIPSCFKAVQLMRSPIIMREGFPEEMMNRMPDMVWTITPRIKDCEHIELFLNELNQLDRDTTELLCKAPLAIEASSHILDQSWLSEGSKPQEEQNWSNLLSFIDQLSVLSCVRENECLRVAVARAKAVVYADYLKQTDHAIAILNDLPKINNSDASFLVHYSKGCFALDAGHTPDAVSFLTAAEDSEGDSFSYYRRATTRQLTIALEMQKEWESAKRYCIKAILNFRENESKLGELELCELLGEIAYIHWVNEDPKKTCGAMYGYVRELIKNEDIDDLRYKEVFNKAGHALGWFASMARWGSPPPKSPDGDGYAPVQPGLFGIRRTKVGQFVSPMGFANSHLLRQLALLAEGVGLLRMARDTLKLSLDRSKIENRDDIHSRWAYVQLATLETILDNPYQALQYGLYARKFFISISALDKDSMPSDYLIDFGETFHPAESDIDKHRKAEERLLYAIFVPLFAKLIGSNLSTTEIFGELEKWNKEVLSLRSELLLIEEWTELIQYYKDLVLFWKNDSDINNQFILFEHKTSFEIFRELLGSAKTKIGLDDAYKSQVRIAISLHNYGEYAKYMFMEIGKFVYRYWLKIAQTRRFALHHPSIFLDELMAISANDGADTLYEVLISAGRAVGVNLSDDVKAQMKAMKKMAKPWIQDLG